MKLFLSYTSADRAWAHWIGVTLRDAGHELFVHEWEVASGENIPAWMERKLTLADKMIGVFSPAYVQAIHSNAERWAAYWQDPAGADGFLVPIEVEKLDKWPVFAANKKRLSLLGLSEAEAEMALVKFLEPPAAPTARPPFPGTIGLMTGPSAGGSKVGPVSTAARAVAAALDFSDGGSALPTGEAVFPSEVSDTVLGSESEGHEATASIIGSREDLERWLLGKPKEIGKIIAIRSALRVMPLLVGLDGRGNLKEFIPGIIMRLLRGIAAAWYVVRYGEEKNNVGLRSAANSALLVAKELSREIQNYGKIENIIFYSESSDAFDVSMELEASISAVTATAFASAVAFSTPLPIDANAAATAARAADSADVLFRVMASPSALDGNPLDQRALTSFWACVSADAAFLLEKSSVFALTERPVWPFEAPFVIRRGETSLKNLLLSRRDEKWHHWLSWLNDRIAGAPADEEKELARLTLPEEMWQAATMSVDGVKAVNAEIARRLAEIDERRANEAAEAAATAAKPDAPPSERGTDYRIGGQGLETAPGARAGAPSSRLQQIYDRLRGEVADLVACSKGLANSHPRLVGVVAEYADCCTADFAAIDLDRLWDVGLGLIERASVLDRDGLATEDRLGAETHGLLNTVVARHSALVHAVPELGARAADAEKMRARLSVLASVAPAMAMVLDRFAEAEVGVESRTRRFLKALALGAEVASVDHYEAAHSAYTNVTNILIRVSQHLDRIDEATPEGARDVLEAVVDGDPENTRALVRIFGELEPQIRAFSEPFPKLRIWIDWIYLRLDRLKKL